ncbi:hypothetical protein [Methanofollis fontis]|uniref:Uncharacterized protein n=1 Tax=Methanofollis fontis TaxID=2052832 RepID=A0A483CT96_9EURY|nr:hypothetical protein [Methanofollis fontis]TAJ45574.1 hypothetical protein CUJ86_02290 [Methanofollis fontis]
MDLEFPRYEHDPALGVTEIEFVARFTGAIPSRQEILAELALVSGADPASIDLGRLRPRARRGEVRGSARITERR